MRFGAGWLREWFRPADLTAMAVFACLAAGSSPTAAAILDVRADGRGTYPTIQAALEAAKPGDTVQLGPGIYAGPGNADLNFRGKAVILQGDPADPGSTPGSMRARIALATTAEVVVGYSWTVSCR